MDKMFSLLFDDKRVMACLLLLWSVTCVVFFTYIMHVDNSSFLNFGPSEDTMLLGVVLDTWLRWWCVALYTFFSTAIASFASDSIVPWITNTIQDHKTEFIPYSPYTCLFIIQVFTFYAVTQSVMHLFVALTQVDFMLLRLLADFSVNHFTTFWFIRDKTYKPSEYSRQNDVALSELDIDIDPDLFEHEDKS